MENKEAIIGNEFNKIKIMETIGRDKKHHLIVRCVCDCGNIFDGLYTKIKNGYTKSCGCLSKKALDDGRALNIKHRFSNSRFYQIWRGMKGRCSNENLKEYKNYGGRGIKVCDKWIEFLNFKEDMYETYLKHVVDFGEKDTTIERVDVNGNYELKNCTWATKKEQSNNQRTHGVQKQFIAISPNGVVYNNNNQMQFAKEHNLSNSKISSCLSGSRNHHKQWRFRYA